MQIYNLGEQYLYLFVFKGRTLPTPVEVSEITEKWCTRYKPLCTRKLVYIIFLNNLIETEPIVNFYFFRKVHFEFIFEVYRVVAPAVKERCKHFVTISIPSITTTLKTGFLFRFFLVLLYKFSQRKYDLECYTDSGVW